MKERTKIKIVCSNSVAEEKTGDVLFSDSFKCSDCVRFYDCKLMGKGRRCTFAETIVRQGTYVTRDFCGWSCSMHDLYSANPVLRIYAPANLMRLREVIAETKKQFAQKTK